MTAEKWVKQSRKEKRRQFGEVGLHCDCVHYEERNGEPFCNVCGNATDAKKHPLDKLQCEMSVCFFYEPKRKENNDD